MSGLGVALDTLPGPASRVPGLPSLMVADGEPRLWGVSS